MPANLLDDHQVPTEYAIYQRFNRLEDMQAVTEALRNNNILVRTSGEDAGEWREATIIGSPLQPKYWIEIPAVQFEKANYVLQEVANENLLDEDLDAHPFAEYSKAAAMAVWLVSILVSLGVLLYYVAGSRRDPKGVRHQEYDEPTKKTGRVAVGVVLTCLVFGLLNYFYWHWVTFPPIDVWYWLWF